MKKIIYYIGGKIKLFPKYVNRLGFFQAIQFLFKSHLSNSIQKYTVRGIDHPLYLRGKTSDNQSFEQIFINEEYKINFSFKKDKIHIIDAGANCGYATVYFKSLYPNSDIVCIEPENSNILFLKKNIQSLGRVKVFSKGLWTHKTRLKIKDTNAKKYSFQVKEDDKGDIEAISLDNILSYTQWDNIDLLKIDIEGSEKKIFSDKDANWISKTNYIVVEAHDKYISGSEKTIKQFAKQNSFHISKSGENLVLKK